MIKQKMEFLCEEILDELLVNQKKSTKKERVKLFVTLIKHRLDKSESGYHVFNYADKSDFYMTELALVTESKMNISIPKSKIPYWIDMLGVMNFIF